MILVTTDYIPGIEIETIAEVKGLSTKEMSEDLRAEATLRMIEAAMELSADAIVSICYSTDSAIQGDSELLASGTAVKFV